MAQAQRTWLDEKTLLINYTNNTVSQNTTLIVDTLLFTTFPQLQNKILVSYELKACSTRFNLSNTQYLGPEAKWATACMMADSYQPAQRKAADLQCTAYGTGNTNGQCWFGMSKSYELSAVPDPDPPVNRQIWAVFQFELGTPLTASVALSVICKFEYRYQKSISIFSTAQ